MKCSLRFVYLFRLYARNVFFLRVNNACDLESSIPSVKIRITSIIESFILEVPISCRHEHVS